jgi:beta-galactosidase
MVLPQVVADKLKAFVEQGGTVIGFAKLGHLDEKGWAWNDRPGAGLTALFGARETNIEVFREPDTALTIEVNPNSPLFRDIAEETILGYWHRQSLELADDAEVLARFVDGGPAIIRRRQGQGQAILMATHLDMAVWEYKDPATIQLFANLMTLCGVTRPVIATGENQPYIDNHIDTHLLELDQRRVVIINNEGASEIEVTLTVPAATQATAATELFSGTALNLTQNDGASCSLRLGPTDGAIVMLQ